MQTQVPFTLPLGVLDEHGETHREGVMRLATARDEIEPLGDSSVRRNDAYLTVLLLARTVYPYAVLLAGCAAIFDFIPVVGPLASGVLVITVTGVTGYTHLLWYIIFWIVFRLFQDYVLGPYLMGSGTELNPMLVLFGVLAGEQVAGVAGMFFSVPVIAALRVIFVRLQRSRQKRVLATVELQR